MFRPNQVDGSVWRVTRSQGSHTPAADDADSAARRGRVGWRSGRTRQTALRLTHQVNVDRALVMKHCRFRLPPAPYLFLPRWPDRHGFTLVEAFFVAVISTAIMAGIFIIFSAGHRAYFTTDAKLTIREDTRKTIEVLSNELHNARLFSYCYASSGNGCAGQAMILTFRLIGNPPYTGGNISWQTTDIAYKWKRQGTPTPLYRCDPATNANCWRVAQRVTNITLTPLDPNGSEYTDANPPGPTFVDATGVVQKTGNMPSAVNVSITITPSSLDDAAKIEEQTTTARIPLLNPQE